MDEFSGDAPASTLLSDESQPPEPSAARQRLVELVIPAYNEEKVLEKSVRRLHSYLTANFPFRFIITVADNGSTDSTFAVAQRMSAELRGVRAVHFDRKGRGHALRQVWGSSRAEVVAYMDADLSTGLDAFLPLVAPLLSGDSDLAIGSRLAHGSKVVRSLKREIVSRGYNMLLHVFLSARVSDAQCGFKAGRTDVIRALLPAVEDNTWFFDTELLMLAQRRGLRIAEVPVAWVEDPDSSVDIVRTALADLRGMARLRFRAVSSQRLFPNGSGRYPHVRGQSAGTELTGPEQHR